MIQNQIPSDIQELNKLHETYEWIPNEYMVRPNSIEMSRKNLLIETIKNEWLTPCDFILNKVFNQDFISNEITNQKFVPFIKVSIPEIVFTESLFRYNLSSNANHYVLWFSKINYFFGKETIDKDFINNIIKNEIIKKTNNFDFAWYINPKPSVPDFFHVQVFWIPI